MLILRSLIFRGSALGVLDSLRFLIELFLSRFQSFFFLLQLFGPLGRRLHRSSRCCAICPSSTRDFGLLIRISSLLLGFRLELFLLPLVQLAALVLVGSRRCPLVFFSCLATCVFAVLRFDEALVRRFIALIGLLLPRLLWARRGLTLFFTRLFVLRLCGAVAFSVSFAVTRTCVSIRASDVIGLVLVVLIVVASPRSAARRCAVVVVAFTIQTRIGTRAIFIIRALCCVVVIRT